MAQLLLKWTPWFVCLLTLWGIAHAGIPAFPLHNAAVPGMAYPAIGLGTGGYGLDAKRTYPECWIEFIPGCAPHASTAVKTWLLAGGSRIDSANSYFNQAAIQAGIAASGVSRSSLFLTSKVGPSNPLGYNETLFQIAGIKKVMKVDYVDLLLVHWPTYAPNPLSPVESTDPACNTSAATYNATLCRLSTWKAMLKILEDGDAKAVGVANFNISHIEEIITAGMTLPAVNQCPFNPYRSSTQTELMQFCKNHNILFNSYSPLGIPDLSVDAPKNSSLLLHKFPPPMKPSLLQDPTVQAIAGEVNRTAAQVILRWEYQHGVPTNPRSMNKQHMKDNIAVFGSSFPALSAAHMKTLDSLPQDFCTDDQWYECAPKTAAGWWRK